MLNEVLGALAATGGTAVVGAMATDAWQTARDGVGRLFRKAGAERQTVIQAQLDSNATLVEQAADPDQARTALVGLWQMELARFLKEHPDAESDLRILVGEVQGRLSAREQLWIQQQNITASAPGAAAFGSISGNVNVHYYGAAPDLSAPATHQAPDVRS